MSNITFQNTEEAIQYLADQINDLRGRIEAHRSVMGSLLIFIEKAEVADTELFIDHIQGTASSIERMITSGEIADYPQFIAMIDEMRKIAVRRSSAEPWSPTVIDGGLTKE